MTDEASLRSRLDRIRQTTAGAKHLPPAAWWDGDTAGERQVRDDIAAGRLYFQTAHRNAVEGLAALDAGNMAIAEEHGWEAYHYLVTALIGRLRPSDLEVLHKPAKKRGRPAGK